MTQRLLEPEGVQQALREIAAAREHLQLASDVLTAFGVAEAMEEAPSPKKRVSWSRGAAAGSPRYRACGDSAALSR